MKIIILWNNHVFYSVTTNRCPHLKQHFCVFCQQPSYSGNQGHIIKATVQVGIPGVYLDISILQIDTTVSVTLFGLQELCTLVGIDSYNTATCAEIFIFTMDTQFLAISWVMVHILAIVHIYTLNWLTLFIFIPSIALTLPIFAAGYFLLPTQICHQLVTGVCGVFSLCVNIMP